MTEFYAAGKRFPLNRTYVMGILNVTPDSFSDGGKYFDPEKAVRHAVEMEAQGVDIVDIGGQSTRPGSVRISPEEEWARIENVVKAVAEKTNLAISIDTFYPEVAEKSLKAGAHIINDVTGFAPEMWRAVENTDCGCIVMHPGDPDDLNGAGGDILERVRAFFEKKTMEAEQRGVNKNRLCFDPGIGFGKTNEENFALIANPEKIRMAGTVAAHTASVLFGADMVRAHDTFEAVQAARVADAIKQFRK